MTVWLANRFFIGFLFIILICFCLPYSSSSQDYSKTLVNRKLRVLIIDGQSKNNDWQLTTEKLLEILLATQCFEVAVSTSPPAFSLPKPKEGPEQEEHLRVYHEKKKAFDNSQKMSWQNWHPSIHSCDVILNHYYGDLWPHHVRKDLISFLEKGGGMVNLCEALLAFPGWAEYNSMIGIGWRDQSFGYSHHLDKQTGAIIAKEPGKGKTFGRTTIHDFLVCSLNQVHPILNGFPNAWLHQDDFFYHGLRGPIDKLDVAAVVYSDPKYKGSGEYEPVVWTVPYEKGRVVNTVIGHSGKMDSKEEKDTGNDTILREKSMLCVGWQALLVRCLEYACQSTQFIPLPVGMPSESSASVMPPSQLIWRSDVNQD